MEAFGEQEAEACQSLKQKAEELGTANLAMPASAAAAAAANVQARCNRCESCLQPQVSVKIFIKLSLTVCLSWSGKQSLL